MSKRIFALVWTLLAAVVVADAGTFNCSWYFTDFVANPLGVKTVFIQPIAPYGVDSTNIITGDRIKYTNTASGLTVSNMANGMSYRVTFVGPFRETVITNSFDTNVTGNVNGKDYIAAPINDAGLVAWSRAAADARYIQTNEVKWAVRPLTNVVFVTNTDGSISIGATGTGGGGGAATNVYQSVGAGGITVYTNGYLYTISNNPSAGGGSANLGLLTNNILYVSSLAADDTGDGSVTAPFQTTTNALAHATNCTIYVTSGQYQWGGLGRNGVHWYLDSDVIIGSAAVTAGPVFYATNGMSFTVSGSGQVLATTETVSATGTGSIRLDGVYVSPAPFDTTNILGSFRTP